MVNAASSTTPDAHPTQCAKNLFYLNELRRTVKWENTFRETPVTRSRFLKGCKSQHGRAATPQTSVTAPAPSDIPIFHGQHCDTGPPRGRRAFRHGEDH